MSGFLRAKGWDKPYAATPNNFILYKTQDLYCCLLRLAGRASLRCGMLTKAVGVCA